MAAAFLPAPDPTDRLRGQWRLAAAVVALVVAAMSWGIVSQTAPVWTRGLQADYRQEPDTPGRTRIDRHVNSTVVREQLAATGAQWVIWTGWLHTPSSGIKGFDLATDGTAQLYVSGQPVVRAADGEVVLRSVPLAGGSYPIRLIYRRLGGEPRLDLRWILPDDSARPLPADALSPRSLWPTIWRLRSHTERLGLTLGIVWLLTAGWVLYVCFGAAAARLFEVRGVLRQPDLRWVLAFTLLLGGYQLWWGLHLGGFWAMDEIGAGSVTYALEYNYGTGWYDKYPPLHYYITGLLLTPFMAIERLGYVAMLEPSAQAVQMFAARTLSFLMGMGTVVVVFVCAADRFGRRAATMASVVWVTTLPFMYHLKLASVDVPYTFWFSLSLLAYLRIVGRGQIRDYLLFAAAAVFAVCTKDQAYGLYAFPVLHVIWLRARRARAAGVSWPRFVTDRALLGAFVLAVALFVVIHNLPFNMEGFRAHVELITGGASQPYRVFEPTPAGQVWLALSVVQQIGWSLSWPVALAALIGIGLPRRADEAAHVWLLLPALSYCVTFIAVIGYCYDRFLLPVCLLLAIYAGRALVRLVELRTANLAARWALATVLVFATWRAASIGVLMAADTRHHATLWLRQNVPEDASIAAVGSFEYLPSIPGKRIVRVPLGAAVGSAGGDYLVANVGFNRRYEASTPQARWLATLDDGSAGYEVVYRRQNRAPLAILPWEGPYARDAWYTSISKLNPEIVIYKRR